VCNGKDSRDGQIRKDSNATLTHYQFYDLGRPHHHFVSLFPFPKNEDSNPHLEQHTPGYENELKYV
jgi:hypothetical protein